MATIDKDTAYSTARSAIVFRRRQVIKYWIDSYKLKNLDSMDLWSEVLQKLNDAEQYLFTH